ncbi:MAG: cupin domain-containing protein [Alphaproteobacteria bacterium]|nr:MAG: cupin domain-containing protein [Alphaproteobacteria bacterium]
MAVEKGYRVGESDSRPWGKWTVLALGTGFAIKLIEVAPGQILSLQRHRHRAEHWIVIAGTARVEIDGVAVDKGVNESAFIPAGATHRIGNPGQVPLQFIEVQTGARLEESDIERLEDRYGRVER